MCKVEEGNRWFKSINCFLVENDEASRLLGSQSKTKHVNWEMVGVSLSLWSHHHLKLLYDLHHPTIRFFLMYLECVVWAWFPSNTHPHVLSISPFLQHIIYFFYLKLINFVYITKLRSRNIEFDSSSSPFLKLLYSNNTIVDLRFNISYLFRMLIMHQLSFREPIPWGALITSISWM